LISGTSKGSRPDPLGREELFRRVGSLVGVVQLGFLSMIVQQLPPERSVTIIRASTLTAATIVAAIAWPWRRVPRALHHALPFLFLFVSFIARQATGGIESAYTPLVFLPVLWVAVYGSSLEVSAISSAAALVLVGPLLAGAGTLADLTRTMALIAVAGGSAFVVHRFFEGLRHMATNLKELAGTDPLTGAANRRAWDEELALGIARAARDHYALSVVLIDLDDFKGFNDRQGHQAGDRLLKEVAAAWRDILRASDTLARIGGDEFAALLTGCGLDMAVTIAERLRTAVPSAKCSVGVATWDGRESPEHLIGRADAGLYQAKEGGRDRVVVLPDQAAGADGLGIILHHPSTPEPPDPAA
jgi:diguanylate cyclase (GGDEF)-like protein